MSGLNLSGERKCKQAFASWFKAGGWAVQDMTQPETEKYQFPEILNELRERGAPTGAVEYAGQKYYGYAKAIELPHDGEASRGNFMICFDYKYHKTIKYGMGLEKETYDKYVSWKKPWFYILIYVDDTKKRYIHQIQDPKKRGYIVDKFGGVDHYIIPSTDYWEASEPNFPVKLPTLEGLSTQQSIALTFALEDWAYNDFEGEFKGIQDNDLKRADAICHSSYPSIKLRMRKWKPDNQANAEKPKLKRMPSKRKSSKIKPSKGNVGKP
jgi:hypothetical protein